MINSIMIDKIGNDGIATKDNSEAPKTLESYWPKDYPKYLFSGTLTDNAAGMKNQGMAEGFLSANIVSSLDNRFHRGSMIVAVNDPEYLTKSSFNPIFFEVKYGTCPEREVTYTNEGTETWDVKTVTQSSTKMLPVDHLASFEIGTKQYEYINMAIELLNGSICQKKNPEAINCVKKVIKKNRINVPEDHYEDMGITQDMYPSGSVIPEVYGGVEEHYLKDRRQEKLSKILGVSKDNFESREKLSEAINEKYGGEEGLIAKLAEEYPGEVAWQWKGVDTSDKEMLSGLFGQIFQTLVVWEINSIYNGKEEPIARLNLRGESEEALKRIKEEKVKVSEGTY